jgi:hypothetical protein
MVIFSSSKRLFFLFLDRIDQRREKEGQVQAKSNCASSVCVQTNAPHARWGSTPIPFNITGGTGDELSNDYRYADILQIINRRKSALQLKNPSERNSLKDHSLFLILFFTFAF